MYFAAEYLGPFIVANIVALLFLAAAINLTRLARVLFVILFLAAGVFNIYTAFTKPQAYLVFGDLAILDVYRNFVHGFFSEHTRGIVVAIATGQLALAALLSTSGRLLRLGAAGAVVFFVAISPLGAGSAFPAPLLLAAAIIVMLQREQHKKA